MKYCSFLTALLGCILLAAGCSGPAGHNIDASLVEYEASRPTDKAPATIETDAMEVRPAEAKIQPIDWLAKGEQMEKQARQSSRAKLPAGEFVPWRKRRGPAYPGDFWRSFGRDAKELVPTAWDDTVATFKDKWALAGFAAAVVAGVAIDAADWNGSTADHYEKKRSQLNTDWDNVGDVGGNPGLHFAVAGAMYFTTLAKNDTKNYEISKTLINALAVNGIVTMALKGIANSDSPNDDPMGWPSGHTSSTFCFASVMHRAYGPWVGMPLYAFATFVGYERIDARNHDLNDVVSGALIGLVIGHAVFQNHEPRIFGMELQPWVDPESNAVGLSLTKRW